MRSVGMVAVAVLMTAGMTYAQSVVTYTVETGGNNHVSDYESKATPMPYFTSGVTDGSTSVPQGLDLSWAVRVTVSGAQTGGGAGDSMDTFGAANLVFDLYLYQADGTTPVANFGAAPLACTTGTPGTSGAKGCKPSNGGFWSNMNDGDTDNPNNPAETRLDPVANAAFAWGIYADAYPPPGGSTLYKLTDPAGVYPAVAGPNLDYAWYPTTNGRGGVDIDGSKPINTGVTTVNSALAGFGAGYKSYDLANHRAGVGVDNLGFDMGYGADRPLFEGQINTSGLALGTYVLKVVPSADGNNVIHGNVAWDSTTANYGTYGSFAVKANSVVGSQVSFTVTNPPPPPTAITGRYVFYNQCNFDGNRVTVDAAPVSGAPNDDNDAVDTTKAPLIVITGTPQGSVFANYSTYSKGLNGLVYDVASATRNPIASDFTFKYYGRTGTSAPVTKTPTAVVSWANTPTAGTTRTFIAFANNDVQNGWLEVTVGTGFGAAGEVHWWGNCMGEAKDNAGNMVINALDLSKVKASYTIPNGAVVSWDWDFDKNRTCNSLDNSYAKSKINTPPTTAVSKITK